MKKTFLLSLLTAIALLGVSRAAFGALSGRDGPFTHTIEEDFGATHRVVPGCPNAQAEAESLHSRIEPEFFDIEDFAGPFDFWNKIAT